MGAAAGALVGAASRWRPVAGALAAGAFMGAAAGALVGDARRWRPVAGALAAGAFMGAAAGALVGDASKWRPVAGALAAGAFMGAAAGALVGDASRWRPMLIIGAGAGAMPAPLVAWLLPWPADAPLLDAPVPETLSPPVELIVAEPVMDAIALLAAQHCCIPIGCSC